MIMIVNECVLTGVCLSVCIELMRMNNISQQFNTRATYFPGFSCHQIQQIVNK